MLKMNLKQFQSTVKKPSNNSFLENLRNYFEEYSKITGIHGFFYLNEKRSYFEKILWILILLCSLAGCLFMISLIIQKYKNNPVVVTFGTSDTPIYAIPFPAVTICPESKCLESKFNFSKTYMKLMANQTISSIEERYFYYTSLLCNDNSIDEHFMTKNISIGEDFFDIISEIKPDDELVECSFMGEATTNCSNLFVPVITDSGVCYSFNVLDRKDIFRETVVHYKNFHNVSAESPDYSIDNGYLRNNKIKTYPRRALMAGAKNSLNVNFHHTGFGTDYLCDKYLEGYRILVHSPEEIPQISNFHFRVPLDKTVVTAVSPDVIATSNAVKVFDPKTRNCYLQDERPLKFFKQYSQSNCLFECLTNVTLNTCGCVKYYMPSKFMRITKDRCILCFKRPIGTNGTKICGISEAECCSKTEWKLNTDEIESAISKSSKSKCDCKPACTSLNYNVEISVSHYFFKEYLRLVGNGSSEPTENDHFSDLSIYFKVDHFIYIERNELYGPTDFISSFGGLLGLFTGFSIISAIEIVYFATIRIVYNLKLYGKWFGEAN